MDTKRKIAIVVPCYNEAKRLKLEEFKSYLNKNGSVTFIFVNDGSTDNTLEMLKSINRMFADQSLCISQEKNSGKAEAVRQGFLKAIETGFDYIGYWDADLSAPLNLLNRLTDRFKSENVTIVMGSRVRLLGRNIMRNAIRHYLGRVFATFASLVLDLLVYDTQCGAKVFKNNQELRMVFSQPFTVSWIFDVEILARLKLLGKLRGRSSLKDSAFEYPLEQWTDIKGSNVNPFDYFIGFIELFKIYAYLNFPVIRRQYVHKVKL